ncbi:TPA: phage head morphogenesis protein [Enterococcus faecalis]|nr:phage head morphogenesis protein [Enterococcus faecalis]EHN4295475.1 minor capsid protein [Enterococcus faecalis]EHN4654920.1 minor capsid protein [Enterococcus faecalis]EHQ9060437.1 minor capsid protein [Enterococcus faecalis]EJX9274110.1 minor capsid protein [Enterococcus faecalis]
MSKLNYWQKRMLQVSIDRDKEDRDYIKEMELRYDLLAKSLKKTIDDWIARYANEHKISFEEANALLAKDDLKNWKMSLAEFKRKAIEGGYLQELNEEYFRSRISRTQQLQRQLYFQLAEQANKENSEMATHLMGQLDTVFLKNIYEISDRGQIPVQFAKYNVRSLEVAIKKPWLGANFSKRIWKNHLKVLPDKLARSMSIGIINGWSTDKIVDDMMLGIDKQLRNRMISLVQTESAHIAEVATDKAMKETGVQEWEWLATLEVHTCSICASLDGKIFSVDDKSAPICPAHPNCRCTKIPVIVGWQSSKRWQRNPESGLGEVKNHQSFNEWKKSLSNNKKIDLIELNRDNIGNVDRINKMISHTKDVVNQYKKATGIDIIDLWRNKKYSDKSNPYNDEKSKFVKYLLKEYGYDAQPNVVESVAEGMVPIYRGIRDSTDGSMSSKQQLERFIHGEFDISGAKTSTHGRGSYFTDFKLKAEDYSNRGENGRLIKAYLGEEMNLISSSDLDKELQAFLKIKDNLGKDAEYYQFITSRSGFMDANREIYAILSGYDGVKFGAVYNILNRGKLVVKK